MPDAPYEITADMKRFDQRNSAFARSQSDSSSVAYGKKGRSVAELIASDKPGYGREEFALHAGSRTADRALRKSWQDEDFAAVGEPHQPDDWQAFTERVKQAAKLYGASLAGVTRVNPLWLYAPAEGAYEDADEDVLPPGVDTAIVMATEMDHALIAASPAVGASAATGLGYSQMAFVAGSLAAYLRQLGYRAIPSGNDTGLSVPLAIDAGLGELGRNGVLLTQPFGPRVRLCKVFTDAPLTPDAPTTFGAADRCETCTACADACPARALPTGERTAAGPTPSNNSGALKWYNNADKCLAFWRVNGTSCSSCIKSCPLNQPAAE